MKVNLKHVCTSVVAVAMLMLLALPALTDAVPVTGGTISPLGTDAISVFRDAPDGWIGCYNDQLGDGKFSMCLDLLSKPAQAVKFIRLQNTNEYATWAVLRKVNILVSSHEDEVGFDPTNTSLYDTTVLSNGTVTPDAQQAAPTNAAGIEAGLWRYAELTTPAAKRYFLIEVTDNANGPVSDPASNYFIIGDVDYAMSRPPINGFAVTGGRIKAVSDDSMGETRPAPNGYLACYANQSGDAKYSMCLDLLSKPTSAVKAIRLQNTTEWDTWRVIRKVNILVSSHEDEYGFDPTNTSLYDTTVLSNGIVMPEALHPTIADGIWKGLWRTANLTTPVAKRFFLIEVTDCPDGPISIPASSYFFMGDVNYATDTPPINGFNVTGGKIKALGTDAMGETRPAPNGYLACYADPSGDAKYSMCLDLLSKPAEAVRVIRLQNTTEFDTWRVIRKVNILVSSHEDEAGFEPTNTSLYDTPVLSNGIVTPEALHPTIVDGIWKGLWRDAALDIPVAKRFFLIEVTDCPDGPISDPATSYFFMGDVNYSTYITPVVVPTIQAITGTVTVDANLSDWDDATWIPMDATYNGTDSVLDADIPDGFSCYAAKWSQTVNKIYVAVKIKDLAHKFLDAYTGWDLRDGIELYLHTTATAPVNFFSATPPFTSAQCYATGVNTSGGTWFSTSTAAAVPAHAGFQAVAREDGQWLYYEFAATPFDYFDLAGGNNTITNLNVGDSVDLDVIAVGRNGTSYTGMKGIHTRGGLYDNWTNLTPHTITGSGGPTLPVVGASNKAVLDAIMTDAADDYVWVLWGKVTVIDSDSFTIDDGSGVNIEVAASGYADLGVGNGSYVAVRGTFDATTEVLTSQGITLY